MLILKLDLLPLLVHDVPGVAIQQEPLRVNVVRIFAQHDIVLVLIPGLEQLLVLQDYAGVRCDGAYFHF